MPSLVWPLPIWLDHGPNIPGSYAILLFTTSDFTSITSHIHTWVLFLLWLHLFFLSGVISPLISSTILGTHRPGKPIFQCPLCLFYCSWGSQGKNTEVVCHSLNHVLSELSTMTCPSWVTLHGMAHSFIELDKAVVHVIRLLSFLWLWFSSVCPLWWRRVRGLWKLPDERDWLRGKLGLVLIGRALLGKSLIQFSIDGWGCVPSLLFTWAKLWWR